MRHLFAANGPPAGPDLSTRLEPDFHHVDVGARISISVVRTLRIPDDGRVATVPSGLGRLPMLRMRDLSGRVPPSWARDRGVLLPVYQSEALRLLFETPTGYPFAVKVATDGRNVATGHPWRPGLRQKPRNYLVVPGQHHLDGMPDSAGRLQQLVARPLDDRGTEAGHFDNAVTSGGVHLVVTPLHADRGRRHGLTLHGRGSSTRPDPFGPDAWDDRHTQTCVLRFVQAQRWQDLTGQPVPHAPIARELYHGARVPWFEYFEADREVPNQGRMLGELDGEGWRK